MDIDREKELQSQIEELRSEVERLRDKSAEWTWDEEEKIWRLE